MAMLQGTRDVLAKGWLDEPYSKKDLDVMHDGKWIQSRRFTLRQKSKIRLIDDMSSSFVNMAVGTHEMVDLEVVDGYLSLVND